MESSAKFEIAPLDETALSFALDLLVSQLPEQSLELGKIGESPQACCSHSLGKFSLNRRERMKAEAWAQRTRILLARLGYFIATEETTGQRVGVSGLYSVLPGYLDRESPGASSEAAWLETPAVFWMGWTAVVDGMKGSGIGTLLMKHGISVASEIAARERIKEPYWAVLADVGAVSFYEGKGFTKVREQESGVIFADPLEAAARKVNRLN